MRLILASSSPRRREFMAQLGLPFTIEAPDTDEGRREGESPASLVARLAREKAEAVLAHHPGAVVVAADTVVALGEEIFLKPRDAEDAFQMLRRLCGRTHEVFTGLAVLSPGQAHVETVESRVTFTRAPDALLRRYVASGEPLDKSGSYAVQGLAAMLVERVEGSVTSVVGLPLAQLRMVLEGLGMEVNPTPKE
ncbi:MAG: Maf family protein [Succinivibrionaceae bacterium]|nr:Maf family protein [Succinivibrionaceae bacterium]